MRDLTFLSTPLGGTTNKNILLFIDYYHYCLNSVGRKFLIGLTTVFVFAFYFSFLSSLHSVRDKYSYWQKKNRRKKEHLQKKRNYYCY